MALRHSWMDTPSLPLWKGKGMNVNVFGLKYNVQENTYVCNMLSLHDSYVLESLHFLLRVRRPSAGKMTVVTMRPFHVFHEQTLLICNLHVTSMFCM